MTNAPEGGSLDVIDVIYSTRSMRRLRTEPIPESVIWELLDAAIRGPSSGNVQRWAWIVVTDMETKRKIAEWYRDAWFSLGPGRRERLRSVAERFLPRFRAPLGDDDHAPDPNDAAGEHLANNLEHAPVWVIAAQRGVRGEPNLVDGADIFGAVQNLMLAARSYGIGSTLTMLHRRRERDVAKVLGLPADVATIALIPLGYPERPFSVPRRRPVEEVVHWERWGAHRRRARG